jgi:hypothetical protein
MYENISLATERVKTRDVWFIFVLNFIRCGVSKGMSGVVIFGVDNIVDCFSPEK